MSTRRSIAMLAPSQILSWGGLYYSISLLAPAIERDLGWSPSLVVGAFSWSLLVAGAAGTPVGIWIDRYGGRTVMACGSVLASVALAILALAHHPLVYLLGWTLAGLAMSGTLYEAAFASLTRLHGVEARRAISTLTLFAGLASTIAWPATLAAERAVGWRDTFWLLAALQLFVCLPLHLGLPHADPAPPRAPSDATLGDALRDRSFWLLGGAFAFHSLLGSAISVYLIPLLGMLGHDSARAVLIASCVGPLQVAGRIVEMRFAHSTRVERVGMLMFAMLPVGMLALQFGGASLAGLAIFCVAFSVANGVLTIVRGALPLALFGSAHYGAISGALSVSGVGARAAGPVVLALLLPAGQGPGMALLALSVSGALAMSCYYCAVRRKR